MKTLSLELSKRLSPYLEDTETEYIYSVKGSYYCGEDLIEEREPYIEKNHCLEYSFPYKFVCKVINLEEAIDFLISLDTSTLVMEMNSFGCHIYYKAQKQGITEKTKIQAIESMLIYLLDNKLIDEK